MPRLRPGIGKQDEGAVDRLIRELRDQIARVAAAHLHVGQRLFIQRGQQLRHAIDEWLGADEADIWMTRRLPGQMLAAAETDLEPDLAFAIEQRRRPQLARRSRRDAQRWQQIVDQPLLPLRQRLSRRAAIKPVFMLLLAHPRPETTPCFRVQVWDRALPNSQDSQKSSRVISNH